MTAKPTEGVENKQLKPQKMKIFNTLCTILLDIVEGRARRQRVREVFTKEETKRRES